MTSEGFCEDAKYLSQVSDERQERELRLRGGGLIASGGPSGHSGSVSVRDLRKVPPSRQAETRRKVATAASQTSARRACWRAACPILRRRSRSLRRSRTAPQNAFSVASVSTPVTPSTIASAVPPKRYATLGTPLADASANTMP